MSDNNKTILESVSTKAQESINSTVAGTGIIKDKPTLRMLTSLSFWMKFYAVLGYIGSGFMILLGLLLAITIVGIFSAIIYWGGAGLSIWISMALWKAAVNIKDSANSGSQDEYNSSSLLAFNNLKTFYKVTGILNIISIAFLFIVLIMVAAFWGIISNTPEFKKALQQGSFEGNSSMMGGSYQGANKMSGMDGMDMNDADHDAMMKAMEQATSAATATQTK